jgi:integrase
MAMPKLTARKVETLSKSGMHSDGEGLYLHVSGSGAKSWILRTVVHSRRRDIGLGSASLVSLAEARESARALRKIARQGGDPLAHRRKETLTLSQAAERVHASLLPTWRNAKHATNWLSSIEAYVNPKLGSRPLDTIGTADVLMVLSPIWTEKHETASRLKQRLSTIFDWAKGAGHYPHENPVNGVKKALPPVRRRAEHLAAMDWRDVPAFMQELATREGVSARSLEFLILTAARSNEARGARWDEISGDVWTVPADRMKRGVPHRVPLSTEAVAVLERLRDLDPNLIFPSNRPGVGNKARPQSVMVFASLLKRMKRAGFTVHGFRSTFRDWASEYAHADREVAEAALSDAVGNEVEQAYARSDLFERRRRLMEEWARFVTGASGNVFLLARVDGA